MMELIHYNSLILIKLSVLLETHHYYKHDGSGLKSLIRSSNLKLERDAIYKQVMGFTIIKKIFLIKMKI